MGTLLQNGRQIHPYPNRSDSGPRELVVVNPLLLKGNSLSLSLSPKEREKGLNRINNLIVNRYEMGREKEKRRESRFFSAIQRALPAKNSSLN